MSKLDIMHLPKKDNWETPQELFDKLHDEFNFRLDVSADEFNHKCKLYFDVSKDGLVQDWAKHAKGGAIWMNPPYGRVMKHWIEKAYKEHIENNVTIVGLIPADITDTGYFWEFIYKKAEIRFIKGRLKFKGYDTNGEYITKKPAPFPSMVVIWRGK